MIRGGHCSSMAATASATVLGRLVAAFEAPVAFAAAYGSAVKAQRNHNAAVSADGAQSGGRRGRKKTERATGAKRTHRTRTTEQRGREREDSGRGPGDVDESGRVDDGWALPGRGLTRQVEARAGARWAPALQASMIDLIFAVEDPAAWHARNVQQYPQHYSALRWLGPRALAAVQELGAGVYFNTNVAMLDEQIKYGVVSVNRLVHDLRTWETLYLSGRLHKPVTVLRDEPAISAALAANRDSALQTALLLVPERFSTAELLTAVAGLSYTGDVRMALSENPHKVANIVAGQFAELAELYVPRLGAMRDVQAVGPPDQWQVRLLSSVWPRGSRVVAGALTADLSRVGGRDMRAWASRRFPRAPAIPQARICQGTPAGLAECVGPARGAARRRCGRRSAPAREPCRDGGRSPGRYDQRLGGGPPVFTRLRTAQPRVIVADLALGTGAYRWNVVGTDGCARPNRGCGRAQPALADTVRSSSAVQSVKGLLTAGVVKSVAYVQEKRRKRLAGLKQGA